MILMRLVWLQRRDYHVRMDYRARANLEAVYRESPGACAFPFARFDRSIAVPLDEVAAPVMIFDPIESFRWLQAPAWQSLLRSQCHQGRLQPDMLVRFQQWQWVTTVFLAALTVRFLSGTWLMPLITVAALMSRGSLVSEVGRLSSNGSIFFCMMLWLASTIHFLRTGSGITLTSTIAAGTAAMLLDLSLAGLLMALPVVLWLGFLVRRRLTGPILNRFRQERRKPTPRVKMEGIDELGGEVIAFIRRAFRLDSLPMMTSDTTDPTHVSRGGLFRTIRLPFALWIFQNRRWFRVVTAQLLAALGVGALAYIFWYGVGAPSIGDLHIGTWFQHQWQLLVRPIDFHFAASLLVIAICALQSPSDGILCFFEVAWILLISLLLVILGAVALDFLDWHRLVGLGRVVPTDNPTRWLRAPNVLIWFEPVVIGFAIAGLFNLMKIVDFWLFSKESETPEIGNDIGEK